MRIRFEGLCAFSRRQNASGDEIAAISLPNGATLDGHLHAHKALLAVPAAYADPKRTTWNPDYVMLAPDQAVLCVWNITGVSLATESSDRHVALRDGALIDFTLLHPGSTPTPNPNRGMMTIRGGLFAANRSSHAPTVDILKDTVNEEEIARAVEVADEVIWESSENRPIVASNRGSIVFRAHPGEIIDVTICNSAGHPGSGLDHVACYYPLFQRPADTPQIKLRPTPPDPKSPPFIDLGWNCVPPGQTT